MSLTASGMSCCRIASAWCNATISKCFDLKRSNMFAPEPANTWTPLNTKTSPHVDRLILQLLTPATRRILRKQRGPVELALLPLFRGPRNLRPQKQMIVSKFLALPAALMWISLAEAYMAA